MDKTKIFEAAGKYAAKGQIDKAAKEYQRILDEDPKDVRALQKLAEVYQKSGRVKEATDLMMRVADGYSEQGFFLKAVAVYKQLLKSGVERIEVNQKLAQLYQQLGLIGDATQQYQLVANFYDQQGNIKESLAALRRMVELDPDNVASQVKLGELYAREQLIPEAVTELRKAAGYLKRNNRSEDYFRVLERIGQLAPDDVEAARELAQNYIAVADTKRALAKLQVCFRHDPKDVETLRLLARAFIDLGQEAKAVSVYRELAKVHHERQQFNEYRQTLERIVELSPEDPEAVAELKQLAAQQAPSVIAPPPPAATATTGVTPAAVPSSGPKLSRTSRPLSPDVPPAIAKILTETDVYLKYNLVAKAAEHIKKALIEDADCLDAQEKLLVIQEKQGKTADALATLVRVLELSRARGDQDRISEYTQELAARAPDHPLVQEAAAAAELPGDEDEIVLTPDDDSDEAIIIQPDEEDFGEGIPINTDPTYPPLAAAPMAAPLHLTRSEPSIAPWDRIVDGEEQAVVVEASQEPSSRPQLDLGDDAALAAELDSATDAYKKPSAHHLDPFALAADGLSVPDDAVVVPDDEIPHFPPPISYDSGVEVSAAHEFLAERGSEASLDELPTLDSQPLEDQPLAPVEPEPPAEPTEADTEAAAVDYPDELPAPPASEVPPPEEEDDFAEEYAEAEFLLQQGLEEDARSVLEGILLAAPDHPRASALLQSITHGEAFPADPPLDAEHEAAPAEAQGSSDEGDQAAPASGEYFDLAGALADELQEEAAAPRPASGEGTHSVEDVLAEFKKQLSVTVSAEDSQTHYDLGIAYKEMGLYDEAIHEFEIALEGRGRRRVIDCLTMLGVCRLEKGDPRAALQHFEQALKTPGLTLEASKEAHFEIGHCHELLGDGREAYDHYARVYKADQTFRDVKVRVARLRQSLGGQSGIIAPVNGSHGTNGAPASQANGTSAPSPGRAPVPPASPANAPSENTGPRGGRGKIGYI